MLSAAINSHSTGVIHPFGEVMPLFWTKVRFLPVVPLQNHRISFWPRDSIPKQWTIFWLCYRNSNNIRTLQCCSEAWCSPGITNLHSISFFSSRSVIMTQGQDGKGPLRLWGRNQDWLFLWSSPVMALAGDRASQKYCLLMEPMLREPHSQKTPVFCYKIMLLASNLS